MTTEGLLPGSPGKHKQVTSTSAEVNISASSDSVEIVLTGRNADDMPIKRRSIEISRAEWAALTELVRM